MTRQHLRVHPDVIDTELAPGEIVLLHMKTTTYSSLNATGSRVWSGLKQGLSVEEIGRRLQEEFDVDEDQAHRSVLSLVADLLQHQLLQEAK
jgi:Coenzyme PQQ synthesis protein D (PqqD)